MVADILKALFGGGRNVISETAGIFTINKENQAERDENATKSSLDQFGQEFKSAQRTHWFDRFIDGVNRIPRPFMALGIIGLFISAMVNPVWFSSRMTGIALIPEPMWWLLGAIVAFYFGGRHQSKVQNFNIDQQLTDVRKVIESREMIESYKDAKEVEIEVLQASIPENEDQEDAEQSFQDQNAVINDLFNRAGTR